MMRSRMGGMDDNPVAEDREPAKEEGSETPPQESSEQHDQGPVIYASKEAMGNKQWKEGEEIVFKIKKIDPETGEGELYYAPEKPGTEEPGEPADSMAAMDKAMPEGQGAPSTGGY